MDKYTPKEFLFPSGAEVNIIPVMGGDQSLHFDASELPDVIPVLALRNAVLFPGTIYPITIGREKSVRLIRDAEKNSSFIAAVPQVDVSVEDPMFGDLYSYGTVARVVKTLDMPDGTITAIIQSFKRLSVDAVVSYDPYITARVHYLEEYLSGRDDVDSRMIAESLKDKASSLIKASNMAPKEAVAALKSIDDFAFLTNFVATTIDVDNFADKVALLQYDDVKVRACSLAVMGVSLVRARADIPNCERVLSEQQDAGAENGVTES